MSGMTSPPLHVAPACLGDARAIAEVHVRSWRHAYRDLLPAPYLRLLSVERREAMWLASLTHRRADLLVAREGPDVVGFVAFGPSRDGDARAGTSEVWACYVDPACWSRGVGRALWSQMLERVRDDQARAVSLWVLERNERALRFYRQQGFHPDESPLKVVHVAGVPLHEARLVLPLAAAT